MTESEWIPTPTAKLEWLVEKKSIQDVEKKSLILDERLGPDPVPFGFINFQWQTLLNHMQTGDELWTFRSPDHYWEHLAGQQGIALVRDGVIIADIITKMN